MSTAVTGAAAPAAGEPTAGDVKISELSNDSLVTRLLFTTNHLSRWISPIHDLDRLERSPFRGMPSPKELLIRMRDREQLLFPKMHAIAVQNDPDLDRLARPDRTLEPRRDEPGRARLADPFARRAPRQQRPRRPPPDGGGARPERRPRGHQRPGERPPRRPDAARAGLAQATVRGSPP